MIGRVEGGLRLQATRESGGPGDPPLCMRRGQWCASLGGAGRGQRTASGPGWVQRLAAPRGTCGSVPVMQTHCGVADGVEHQNGPSSTACSSSEQVKAHTL